MNSPTDTDYTDAKAEAIAATLALDAKEYQAKSNIRLDAMNARLDTTNNKLEATNNKLEATNVRLEAINVRLDATNVRIDATNARLDAINHRLYAIEQSMQAGFKSLREELATQLAQFEVRILHAQAESFKWIIGAVIGGIAISTSISAVLINNTNAKPPTPIVIYTQASPK